MACSSMYYQCCHLKGVVKCCIEVCRWSPWPPPTSLMPPACVLAHPERAKHDFMYKALRILGCFAPILAEKDGFSKLHQIPSAPGLSCSQVAQSCYDVGCGWGSLRERAVGGTHWDVCERRRKGPLQLAHAASCRPNLAQSCGGVQRKSVSNWGGSLQHGRAGGGPSFRAHICPHSANTTLCCSCCLPAAPDPTLLTPPCRTKKQLSNTLLRSGNGAGGAQIRQGQGSAASLHQRIEEKRKAMHAEEALPTSSNNKETRVDSKKPEIPSSKDF
eukprot:1159706-Pelagomonas_calceolata.AAC.6